MGRTAFHLRLLIMGLALWCQPFLAAQCPPITEVKSIWLGFVGEHHSALISSFGHCFLVLSRQSDRVDEFDPVAMVMVPREQQHRSLKQQDGKLGWSNFYEVREFYLKRQRREISLHRLTDNPMQRAAMLQRLREAEGKPLPYTFAKLNCSFHCLRFLFGWDSEALRQASSRRYLMPRDAVRLATHHEHFDFIERISPGGDRLAHDTQHPLGPQMADIKMLPHAAGPTVNFGISSSHRQTLAQASFRLGFDELHGDEINPSYSRLFAGEIGIEGSTQGSLKTAIILLDAQRISAPPNSKMGFSKMLRLGFDERRLSQGWQSGAFLRYSLGPSYRIAPHTSLILGPEACVSSRGDWFQPRMSLSLMQSFGRTQTQASALIQDEARPVLMLNLNRLLGSSISACFNLRQTPSERFVGLGLQYTLR